MLIDDHQKREVAGVDGRILRKRSTLISTWDGEEGMMLLTMIWSAFIPSGRIHRSIKISLKDHHVERDELERSLIEENALSNGV